MINVDEQTKKVEVSIPVQSRIDIRVLAEMVLYWDSQQKYVKSMSQLVNWSMDLCSQILKVNNLLPMSIESMLEGNELLTNRGLYQGSMYNRAQKKIMRARQLENLRLENIDPETWAKGKGGYNKAHNHNSIEPAPDTGFVIKPKSAVPDDEWNRYQAKIKAEKEQARKDMISKLPTDSNGIVQQPDMKGTYTAEQRELDINKAKDSLGINKYKDVAKAKPKDIPADTMSTITDIFNSIKARTQPKPASPIPAKVSDEHTKQHIEKVIDKDKKEQDSWDSVEVGDLKPIK